MPVGKGAIRLLGILHARHETVLRLAPRSPRSLLDDLIQTPALLVRLFPIPRLLLHQGVGRKVAAHLQRHGFLHRRTVLDHRRRVRGPIMTHEGPPCADRLLFVRGRRRGGAVVKGGAVVAVLRAIVGEDALLGGDVSYGAV